MGEQLNAVFTLTAQAMSGATLQNYSTANGFAKLNPAVAGNPLVFGAVNSAATPSYLTARLDTSLAATGSFASGVANVSAPLGISRGASADGPYAKLDIGIAPQDSDGAKMATYNLDTDAVAGNDHTKVARTEVRYGRIKLSNAYGSELLPLPIAVTAQYWNGLNYVTSITDSLSSFAATDVVFSNYQPGLTAGNYPNSGATSVTPTSVVFNSGAANYLLAKPGMTGSVDMTTNVPIYLPSNTARATFGVYKGPSEFIYLRENY
jgi:MSHA biogenesis protein MshQ